MPVTNDKRPLKVFLCHAHADRDAVRTLYTRLTKDGVDAWFDKEKLLPGQDWELEIRKAVREADVVVVCLSKQFNQAGFRQKEVRLALDTAIEQPEGEIFIIPARLEILQESEIPESMRKWHRVDLFEDDGYEKLIQALRARAAKIGATLQIKKGRVVRNNSRDDKGKIFAPESSAQLSNEIIIPLASSLEDCILYLRKYFTQHPHTLYSSLGSVTWKERFNTTSQEWQTLFFRLKPETIIVEGKEVKGYGDIGEKIGVFSVSRLSDNRSKLQVTRSDQSEEFIAFIVELVRQLQGDKLIDGELRGFSIERPEGNKQTIAKGGDKVVAKVVAKVVDFLKMRLKAFSNRFFDIKYFSVLIALIVLLFGNNIYGQIIGRSVFAGTFTPTATITLTSTSQPATPSPTVQPSQTPTLLPTFTPTRTQTPILNLTPTPVPTESILLQENFEKINAIGWDSSGDGARLSIDEEANGNYYLSLTGPGVSAVYYENVETSLWTDYAFESRIMFVSNNDILASICIHVDDYTYYKLRISGPNVTFVHQDGSSSGPPYGVQSRNEFVLNQWYTIRLEIKGSQAAAYIDNVLLAEYQLESPLLTGQGGLGYQTRGGDEIFIDDIKVWSLE